MIPRFGTPSKDFRVRLESNMPWQSDKSTDLRLGEFPSKITDTRFAFDPDRFNFTMFGREKAFNGLTSMTRDFNI